MARTAQIDRGARIAFGEPHLFVGQGLCRLGAARRVQKLPARARAVRGEPRTSSATARTLILYAILDFIVDNFMDVLEAMREHVDDIEDP